MVSLKCLCRYRFDEHLLLSGINLNGIEDEPNGRADVIDALIVSLNGLLFELSIPDGSRNRPTSRGFYVRSRPRSAIADYVIEKFSITFQYKILLLFRRKFLFLRYSL